MLKKLDPARKGMTWGCMAEDEQKLIKDAMDANKAIVRIFSEYASWDELVSVREWGKNCSYWTDWERPEEEPRFKLFEIDWSLEYPIITHHGGIGHRQVYNGLSIQQYRIFGYTDNANWVKENEREDHRGPCLSHYALPCDNTGNRKYAIGRLEND